MSLTENPQAMREAAIWAARDERIQKLLLEAFDQFAEDNSDNIIDAIQTGVVPQSLRENWRWYKIRAMSRFE